MYLGVCKLLDQAAALPAELLPQFQMYRWAFVREGEVSSMVRVYRGMVMIMGLCCRKFLITTTTVAMVDQCSKTLSLMWPEYQSSWSPG